MVNQQVDGKKVVTSYIVGGIEAHPFEKYARPSKWIIFHNFGGEHKK